MSTDFPTDIPIDERLLSMNESLYFEFLDENQKEYKSTSGSSKTLFKNTYDHDLQQASFVIFDQINDSYVYPKSTTVEIPDNLHDTVQKPEPFNWTPLIILGTTFMFLLFWVFMSQPSKMVL